MVRDDNERSFETFEIMAPETNCGDNGEKLLVVDFVVAFCVVHLAGHESDREECVAVLLREDGRDGVVGGVGLDHCFEGRFEMTQERAEFEEVLEMLEGGGSLVIDCEHRILLEKAGEGKDYARVSRNESPIEVGEAEELLELFDRARKRPFGDGSHLGGRHADAIRRDDEAKEFGLGCVELALFGFDVKAVAD
jgi:hypothetical protein